MNILINILCVYAEIALVSFVLFHVLGIVKTDWNYLKKHKIKGCKFIIKTLVKFPISIVKNMLKEIDSWMW